MTRKDMLDIIRAAKAVETVNSAVEIMTGSSINGKLDDLNRLIDVIRRNANCNYGYSEDGKQDNANYVALMELLQDQSITAEEIYAKVNREREELEAAKREYAIAEERREKREEKAYRQGAEDILGIMCHIIDGRDISDYEKYYMSLVLQAYAVIEKARTHQEGGHGMRVIFLDIDGVLNNAKSNEESLNFPCIDEGNLQHLKLIIDATNASIVLISSWKEDYQDNDTIRSFINEKLPVYDTTDDRILNRGKGILEYLSAHRDVESFVILDDEAFDYEDCGLIDHWIKTSYGSGLTEEDAKKAIQLLSAGEKV